MSWLWYSMPSIGSFYGDSVQSLTVLMLWDFIQYGLNGETVDWLKWCLDGIKSVIKGQLILTNASHYKCVSFGFLSAHITCSLLELFLHSKVIDMYVPCMPDELNWHHELELPWPRLRTSVMLTKLGWRDSPDWASHGWH